MEVDIKKLSKQELIKIIKDSKKGIDGTIIREDKPTRNDVHPTMKPVSLVEMFIECSSIKDENVLDCFGGSGSTLIACEKKDRNCFMMEYDPKYIEVILKRYYDFTK